MRIRIDRRGEPEVAHVGGEPGRGHALLGGTLGCERDHLRAQVEAGRGDPPAGKAAGVVAGPAGDLQDRVERAPGQTPERLLDEVDLAVDVAPERDVVVAGAGVELVEFGHGGWCGPEGLEGQKGRRTLGPAQGPSIGT